MQVIEVKNRKYIQDGKKVITKLEDGYYIFRSGFAGGNSMSFNVTDAVLYCNDKPELFKDEFFKGLANRGYKFSLNDAEQRFSDWCLFNGGEQELTALKSRWLDKSEQIELPFEYVGYIKSYFDNNIRGSSHTDFIYKEVYKNDANQICVTNSVESLPNGTEIKSLPYEIAMDEKGVYRMMSVPKFEPKFMTFTFAKTKYYI